MVINLKAMREGKKLTTRKLEQLSGVSNGYISQIETGKRIPTIDIICKLAKGLKCNPEDLFNCK